VAAINPPTVFTVRRLDPSDTSPADRVSTEFTGTGDSLGNETEVLISLTVDTLDEAHDDREIGIKVEIVGELPVMKVDAVVVANVGSYKTLRIVFVVNTRLK
jgi:hypothetical protein